MARIRPRAVGIALFSFAVGSCRAQPHKTSTCLFYESASVNLTGTLIRSTFPGPPNYESIQNGDAKETYWLLKLAAPVCVDEDKSQPNLDPPQKNVQVIQLVFPDPKIYQKDKTLVGRKITASGTLFGAISGHHHTPVLLTVSDIE